MSLTETFRGKKIRWTQESVFSKDFKLYADNEQIGEIKFPKFLSTTAEITMLGIDYEAFSQSMFKSGMDLKEKTSGKIVASLKTEKIFGPSEITVGDKSFQFETSFFKQRFFIKSYTGATLIEFEMKGFFKNECEVKPEPTFIHNEEFPVLVVFIWYMIIRISERHAAV